MHKLTVEELTAFLGAANIRHLHIDDFGDGEFWTKTVDPLTRTQIVLLGSHPCFWKMEGEPGRTIRLYFNDAFVG